ncbi:DUF4435 domain-containing protein [Streptomyces katsurahamanus]|uniref:DUF4435 domain-containing protein n=1 Tax=Streptomyces katsurahamanus TaxID=2577098 RepID=A0ABW9P1P0_9ACTN|nr:DUF4435 domain-containing protein [Streptomyces katsurahamanus]MQS39453.1 DUF4435 domain-containing protein [Streptomyces katsurahamanus]
MALQQHQSNPVRIANEVGMLRSGMGGPIVLVEGATDTRLFRRLFIPSPQARVIHCKGKSNLLGAIDMVTSRGITGVLGICDADFDRLLGEPAIDNVFPVDHHDTEIMICASPAFSHFYAELYEREADDREMQRTRARLLNYSSIIGKLRLWSIQNGGKVGFKTLNAGEFIERDGVFNIQSCIETLMVGKDLDSNTLLSVAKTSTESPETEISCGHDFTSLLDFDAAIRRRSRPHGREVVEKMLRLSFDAKSFSNTQMYVALRSWEKEERLKLIPDS